MPFRDRTRPSSILSALAPDNDPEISEKTVVSKRKPIVAARWRLCFQTDALPARDIQESSRASGSSSSGSYCHGGLGLQQQQQSPRHFQQMQHAPGSQPRQIQQEPVSFFITVVDPKPAAKPSLSESPRLSVPEALPTGSTFASPFACSVANTLIGRPFLRTLPHCSWQGLGAALMGKETVTAGLAIAMIGAKSALLAEKHYWQATQRNAQLFCRDSSDYGHFVGPSVIALRGPCTNLSLCEKLRVAGMLDVVVIAAPSLQHSGMEQDGFHSSNNSDANRRSDDSGAAIIDSKRNSNNSASFDNRPSQSSAGPVLFDQQPLQRLLEDLSPRTASIETRVLLLYEAHPGAARQTGHSDDHAKEQEEEHHDEDDEAEDAVAEVQRWFTTPTGWTLRPCEPGFCDPGCRGMWLLRRHVADDDFLADARMSVSSSATGRSNARPSLVGSIPLPQCGVGGFPARPLPPLDGSPSSSRHKWEIPPWYETVQRVKQSLLDHNDQKQSDSKMVLSQARAWSTRARFHAAKSRSLMSSSTSSLTSGPPGSAATRKHRKRFLRGHPDREGYATWHNFSVSTAVSTQVLDLPEEADFQLLDQVQDALQEQQGEFGYDHEEQHLSEALRPGSSNVAPDHEATSEPVPPPLSEDAQLQQPQLHPQAHSAPVMATALDEDSSHQWPCPHLAVAAAELDAEAATYHLKASDEDVLAALKRAIAQDRKVQRSNQNIRRPGQTRSQQGWDRRPMTTGSNSTGSRHRLAACGMPGTMANSPASHASRIGSGSTGSEGLLPRLGLGAISSNTALGLHLPPHSAR